MTTAPDHTASSEVTVQVAWDRLVAAAMLGTDRRDPPDPSDVIAGLIADVVDDTVRSSPSERMLAQVAATIAVRRAGVRPGPVLPPAAGPPPDGRPLCLPAAADRWHHLVASWPVLEDEWMLTLITNGWRLAPEMIPDVLARHRRDPIRRARADVAGGPLVGWLVGHLPDYAAPAASTIRPDVSAEAIGELPELPIPPDLEPLLRTPGRETARALVGGLLSGTLVHSHRAVLVNLIARMRPDALDDVALALERVDPATVGFPLASVLADLARTRRRMLDELRVTMPVDTG